MSKLIADSQQDIALAIVQSTEDIRSGSCQCKNLLSSL